MSTQQFTQLPHKLLSVPGPVEVSDDVLLAVSASPSFAVDTPATGPPPPGLHIKGACTSDRPMHVWALCTFCAWAITTREGCRR